MFLVIILQIFSKEKVESRSFDSGLGGLTVLNAIIKQLKGAEIFYIADTLYAPYGDKNKDEIFSRSEKITNFY